MSATATRSASHLPFGALASLLPSVGGDPEANLSWPSTLRLYRDDLAGRRTEAGRLVLLVDDAHLLDDASATLIQQLVTNGDVFVIATVRSGETAPDPITSLWKDRLVERLELGSFSGDDLDDLLKVALGGTVDRATSVKLARHCEGNALFLRELVVGALDDGSLSNEDGIWQLTGPLHPSMRLVEIVGARLSGLGEQELDLLELLAIGEPIGSAVFAALADSAVAEACERKGLISSRFDGQRLEIRLAHPLYHDVMRPRIPALRARKIARALAEATEATGARRRDDMLRVATWRLEGGGARPELMRHAATIARSRHDYPLAERLARAAVAAGGKFEAELLCAQLAGLQGRSEEYERELARLAGEATTDAQRGVVAVSRLEQLYHSGRVNEGLRIADEAGDAISEPRWRDEVAVRRGGLLLASHGFQAAVDAVEPFLRRGEDRVSVWAAYVAGFSLGRLGELESACQVASRAYATQVKLAMPLQWDPSLHVSMICDAQAYRGDLEQAEAKAIEHYLEGVATDNVTAQAFMYWHIGKMVQERGNVSRAIRAERQGAMLFRQLGRPVQVHACLTYLAMAQALSGDSLAANSTLAEMEALALPPTSYTAVDLLIARAWTSVASGNVPGARQLLHEAADLAAKITDRVGGAAALHTLARLGEPGVGSALAAIAEKVEGTLIPAKSAHVNALYKGDSEDLERVAHIFRTLGANLLAAEAAADAAVAWRKHGQPRRAAAAERLSTSLIPSGEQVITPALKAIEGRGRLTRGQRDVALLAATGRANREIAQEMQLSSRTVENTLQRVYEKLGISGRAELKAALRDVSLLPEE